MTVYADVLAVVNLYVDYILLCLVRRTLHIGASGARLVLGALVGAGLSLLGLLPVPGWLGPGIAGASALLVALAAFAPAGKRLLFKCWLALWGASFLLAGFVLFVVQFLPPGYVALVGGAVYLQLSLPVLFGATCAAYGVLRLVSWLVPGDKAAPLAKLDIVHRGQSCTIYAKTDTGCSLREPFSGLPVIVCQRDALGALAPGPEEPQRVVPFQSLGGGGLLYAFKPDSVTAGGLRLDCWVGVTDAKLSGGEYPALYNPDLFL